MMAYSYIKVSGIPGTSNANNEIKLLDKKQQNFPPSCLNFLREKDYHFINNIDSINSNSKDPLDISDMHIFEEETGKQNRDIFQINCENSSNSTREALSNEGNFTIFLIREEL